MATFRKGDTVTLNVAPPTGQVLSLRIDDEGNVQYLVEWVDADGAHQQRWFDENALRAGG